MKLTKFHLLEISEGVLDNRKHCSVFYEINMFATMLISSEYISIFSKLFF